MLRSLLLRVGKDGCLLILIAFLTEKFQSLGLIAGIHEQIPYLFLVRTAYRAPNLGVHIPRLGRFDSVMTMIPMVDGVSSS